MDTVADEILAIFDRRGKCSYFGEAVSQLEHALQAAYCAQQAGSGDALITAALVHDLGHLVEDVPENIADSGVDARHEDVGKRWLMERFGQEVTEPVRLHVAAKRYLCATNPGYFEKLSASSMQSLALQGGPMTSDEVQEFEANEFYREAVALRVWDDQAKIPGLATPTLESYRETLNTVAARGNAR